MINLTIIMPVFMAQKSVKRTMKSLDQLFKYRQDFVVHAIDDCSSDLTYQLLSELAKTRPYLKLSRNKQNVGPGQTRQLGLNAATTEFIGFLDADDEILPEKYSANLDFCLQNECQLITFDAIIESSGSLKSRYDMKYLTLNKPALTRLCLRGELIGCVMFAIYSRNLIVSEQIKFGDWFYEDIEFYYKTLIAAKHLHISTEKCYLKHDTDGSILNSIDERHIHGLYSSCFSVYEYLTQKESGSSEETKSDLSYCLANYIYELLVKISHQAKSNIRRELLSCLNETSKTVKVLDLFPFENTRKGEIVNEYISSLRAKQNFSLEQLNALFR